MANTFLDTFKPGTKILLQRLDGSTVVGEDALTIASINHHNKDLYKVTFEETQIMRGCYCFLMDQLTAMKKAYDESKK